MYLLHYLGFCGGSDKSTLWCHGFPVANNGPHSRASPTNTNACGWPSYRYWSLVSGHYAVSFCLCSQRSRLKPKPGGLGLNKCVLPSRPCHRSSDNVKEADHHMIKIFTYSGVFFLNQCGGSCPGLARLQYGLNKDFSSWAEGRCNCRAGVDFIWAPDYSS